MERATKTTIAARKIRSSTVSSPRKRTALSTAALQKFTEPVTSELHEYGQVDPVLNFLKVRCESWNEGARRSANIFDNWRCRAGLRCNSSRPGKVRHIRSAMVELPTE